jgi:hypothetical protein
MAKNNNTGLVCPYFTSFLVFTLGLIAIVVFSPIADIADAADVTLAWDANTEPDLAGYRIGQTAYRSVLVLKHIPLQPLQTQMVLLHLQARFL